MKFGVRLLLNTSKYNMYDWKTEGARISFSKGNFFGNVGAQIFYLQRWKALYQNEGRKLNPFGWAWFFVTLLHLILSIFQLASSVFSHFFEKVERTKPLEWIYPLVKIYIDEFLTTQSDWDDRIYFFGFLRSIWSNPAEKNMLLIVYWLARFVIMNIEDSLKLLK